MRSLSAILVLVVCARVAAIPSTHDDNGNDNDNDKGPASQFKHVALFSIDGLHASDVPKYIALRPDSTIASLVKNGIEYTNAFTSEPSDSFPGTLAQYTGASPRTTGVWYDDTYDRKFFAPGSNCSGPAGAEGMSYAVLYRPSPYLSPSTTIVQWSMTKR